MIIWERLAQYANFETERLLLRPFAYDDRKNLHLILSNPHNTSYIMPSMMTIEETGSLLVQAFMRSPLGIWAIEDKETRQMIGCIRFENIDERENEAEIGYFLHRVFWGKGFMTEALQTLVYLGFAQVGFHTLRLLTHLENRASQRVAEKVGFQKFRQYKGSDRYSRKMREYVEFQLFARNYKQLEEE
ncbi:MULTISPECIES: GNAT family N-acetyltransferase [unclassified Streptococcus]|uniref:GNAT family N-acetyltransferase n=1 Tax=unclassified Streptococcus TaxID=2608887 RepID=UPI00107270BD|nr:MULTISPECIES: GNAT family N-acetyltransferase [unclassified Streptococcus]MBF0788226.1 GNAT family N-acetyltransferase [Streptococcus sp. 19428wC2_LYSM12]MCQ9212179.1 GNAT family N-acetyltransferase [Streptococcus sp. B01]MCQ9213509.1 GNAT family N-acetyltransferase [Streptococcus sp. O1]TFV04695.1 N-acetyltransferase [Streptococcus sp. LYSM12]